MTEKRLVSVYRSRKKEELYLYVDKKTALEAVPAPLLEQFGQAVLVMHMMLSADRNMARVKAPDVLKSITDKGFYLQMPPPPDPAMQRVVAAREQHPSAGGVADPETC
jgi:uncharacterized protein YcgL (UPF0745 family)